MLQALIIAFTALTSASAESTVYRGALCEKKITGRLQQLGSRDDWTRVVDPLPGGTAYRTPTKKIGTWLELRKFPDHSVQLYKIEAAGDDRYTWTASCMEQVSNVSKGKILAHSENGKKYFRDSDLENLLKQNKMGLIYVWSPGMIYSVKMLSRYQAIAQKLSLKFTALLDPRASQEDAAGAAAQFKFPLFDERVESIELLARSVNNHYPATLFYSNGKLSRVFFGADDAETVENLARKEIPGIKR